MVQLLIGILATWRISSLLVNESGPYDIMGRFRDRVGVAYDERSRPYGKNVVATMLLCLWCTSFWVGAVVAVLTVPSAWLLYALACSAGAIMVDRWMKHG